MPDNDKLLSRVINAIKEAFGGAERAIKDVESWDGSASNYDSTEAYCAACLIDVNSAAGRDTKAQSHCMLPVRGPGDGKGTYVRQAIHAAAGGRGITQVKKPDDVPQVDWDAAVKAAANEIKKAYGEMDEEVPESVMDLTRAVVQYAAIEQVLSQIEMALDDEYAWINDVYMDGQGTSLLVSSKGKLYRFRLSVSESNDVTLGEPEEVAIDIKPRQRSQSIIRQADGSYRWVSVSCTSVLNRVGEIDSTELYDSFVDYAERTGDYPIRQFYHQGKAYRTGKADFLARVGYSLITSGLYDDTELAQAEVAARMADPEYWGDSIGFTADTPEMLEVQSGVSIPVYRKGVLHEISTLPEADAGAWFTNFTNVEVNRMNDKQFAAFVKLFGGDETKARQWLEENPEALNRQIGEAGMLARSQDTDEGNEPVSQPEDQPQTRTIEMDDDTLDVIVDRVVERMQETQTSLTDTLAEITRKMDEFSTALQAHASQLTGLQADRDEQDRQRVMDMPSTRTRVTYRPRNNGGDQPQEDQPESMADKASATLEKIPGGY